MAFFDIPTDEELSPEVREMFEEMRPPAGRRSIAPTWKAMGRMPKIIEVRVKAWQNLYEQCRFPRMAQHLAAMLIAHARRCKTCFASSRSKLDELGFDEATLDEICANPDALPLEERDRLFVRYALKIALDSANLQPQDLREMEANGFSKEEIQEIIGFAAFWIMNIVFSQSMLAGLEEA